MGFTLVVEPRAGEVTDPALVGAAQRAAERAAEAVRGGEAGVVRPADDRILFVPINSVLENADASNRTDDLPSAEGRVHEPAVGKRDLWRAGARVPARLGSGPRARRVAADRAWIPIFLFAMLFGVSMDYEVFLLSRMREAWDRFRDNKAAVALGLEHTGRIIIAAALIMIAAFSGFTVGSFVGLQMFGVGLSVAILLDATVVRALLVPAVMKLMGKWNWYLPRVVARALRVREPLVAPRVALSTPPLSAGNGRLPAGDAEPAGELIHRMEGRP